MRLGEGVAADGGIYTIEATYFSQSEKVGGKVSKDGGIVFHQPSGRYIVTLGQRGFN